MNPTPLDSPFAYLLDQDSIRYLNEEIPQPILERTYEVFVALAAVPYKGKPGIGSFYIVFLDPNRRDIFEFMHADKLYDRFETKYYNEEILLITRTK